MERAPGSGGAGVVCRTLRSALYSRVGPRLPNLLTLRLLPGSSLFFPNCAVVSAPDRDVQLVRASEMLAPTGTGQ